MHFISQELEDYIEQHSEKEPQHLAALNKETYQKILLPMETKPFAATKCMNGCGAKERILLTI